MKTLFYIVFVCLSFSGNIVHSQVPDDIYSPLCKVQQKIGMTDIEISYSRPSLKGRKLLGEIVKEGVEWRTGANAASTIRFDDEVKINGQKLGPGIYAIYTIPGAEKWKIFFNTDIYSDPYEGRIKEADVLHLEISVMQIMQPVETFTIFISNISKELTTASIDLTWGHTLVRIPVEVPNKWSK